MRFRGPLILQRAVVLGVAIFTAVACAGDGPVGQAAPASVAASNAAESTMDSEAILDESPLGRLLGTDENSIGKTLDARGAQRLEEEIQLCMLTQGFDYWPPPAGTDEDVPSFFDSLFDRSLGPEEFAQTYGLGLALGIEYGLTNIPIPDFDPSKDPNTAYRSSLTSPERASYDLALRGEDLQRDAVTGLAVDPQTGEPITEPGQSVVGGCVGEARDRTKTITLGLSDGLLELQTRIDADPRSLQLNASWALCMRGSGYNYSDQKTMFETLMAEFQPLLQRMVAGFGQAGASGQPGDGVVRAQVNELAPELRAEIDAFLDQEIAVAVASVNCDDADARRSIKYEYERLFIAENGEALSALEPDRQR